MYPLATFGLLLWLATVVEVVKLANARRTPAYGPWLVTIGGFAMLALGWAADAAQYRYYDLVVASTARPEWIEEIRLVIHSETIVDRMFGVFLAVPVLAAAAFIFAIRFSRSLPAIGAASLIATAISFTGVHALRALNEMKTQYELDANTPHKGRN
jgi:hypothetical protein